ncbi:MAG: hypothetical protein IKU26_00785 [Clostridia bacterium]|nr:hypothetical protein [Clostridia bacterium]
MAFIRGFRARNGLLTNEVWDFTAQDVTSFSWSNPPGSNNSGVCTIGSGYIGGSNGGDMGGVLFAVPSINYSGWDHDFLLASFDIEGYQGADYKRELRLVTDGLFTSFGPSTYTGNVRVKAYLRAYSNPTTYTDTLITASSGTDVQFHRDDYANVHARTVQCLFANVVYNNSHKVLIGIGLAQDQGNAITWLEGMTYFDYNYFWQLLGGNIPEEDFDQDLGPAGEEGGYGPTQPGGSSGGSGGPGPTFDGTSDPWVDYAVKPGIAALGLVNLYKCDVGSLVNLGAELFPDIHWPTSLQDVGEVLAAVSDSIWNSKLIDYIVSAHIIPVDVTGGNLTDIKVGTRTLTGILARPISDDIVEFDCGTVHIDEYYTNFVDYTGTRCRVYIPFHGFVEIKPEYWQSADLNLKYRFNVIDGSFIAMLYSTVSRHQKPFKSLIGQYTGCACVHVPMTGSEYASMFSGMISGAGGLVTGLASGHYTAAATSALALDSSVGGGGNVQMSNAYNASAGFYGHPCPYVIIERQVSHFSEIYNQEKGFPVIKSMLIGSCSGLTICDDPVLNFGTTDELAKEIIAALKEGVII